jgi:cobyrinic acid a,c-diamide synthase
VIEGNRGLYDGMDHQGTYSTAEIAKLLRAPVIPIIDCTKATSTIAAMVLGCQNMDSNVAIKGVVLNRVATGRQESTIRKAVETSCSMPVVGAIPRLKNDPFPERHMGLVPFQERQDIKKSMKAVYEIAKKYLNLDAIRDIAENAKELTGRDVKEPARERAALSLNDSITPGSSLKIGIIRDSAFQFYYHENFEELERRDAQLIEVSPLRERELPDIDALYIGGGFPETHAIALAENTGFKDSLCRAIETGLPVYAECGGLMYLGKSLAIGGKKYLMAGVFPIAFSLEKKPQAHGYTMVEVEEKNPFFPTGCVLKGHEFHYSRVTSIEENSIHLAFKVKRGQGILHGMDGIWYNNVFATYTHLHALGSPEWADGMIACATAYKAQKKGVKKP